MRNRFVAVAAIAVIAVIMGGMSAHAQASDTMTDDHIARIKTNCQSAIATLDQIHANDAPVFINRNQTYFSISDKLIARLNSRLALNRYDTSALVAITSNYNNELTHFRTVYKQYDDAMADLVKKDCSRQPVGFYDDTNNVRQLRQTVHESISKLHDLIGQYRQAVDTFQSQHEAQLKANSND